MSSEGSDDGFDFKLYRYIPSLALGIVAALVFGLLTAAHIYRMFRSRSWFCIPFIVGGLFETIGYIGRVLSHSDNEALTPYIIQSLLILLAPALYAASIYMTLGRIIMAVRAPHHSIIPIRWQTRLFVCGDVLAFLTQMSGGGIQASGNLSSFHTGEKIILAGLFLQIVFFGFFVACSAVFHVRCVRRPTPASSNPKTGWQKMVVMLYTVSGLILLRSVFRVVEYAQGNNGPLLRHEWPIYAFDAVLMALTMLIFLIWYPSILKERVKEAGNNGFGQLESLERDERQTKSAV